MSAYKNRYKTAKQSYICINENQGKRDIQTKYSNKFGCISVVLLFILIIISIIYSQF